MYGDLQQRKLEAAERLERFLTQLRCPVHINQMI